MPDCAAHGVVGSVRAPPVLIGAKAQRHSGCSGQRRLAPVEEAGNGGAGVPWVLERLRTLKLAEPPPRV
jgi:hypothetical protein